MRLRCLRGRRDWWRAGHRIARDLATILRTESPEIRSRLGMEAEEAWRVFGELRARKDRG